MGKRRLRGSRGGIETFMRILRPSLLDNNGDTVGMILGTSTGVMLHRGLGLTRGLMRGLSSSAGFGSGCTRGCSGCAGVCKAEFEARGGFECALNLGLGFLEVCLGSCIGLAGRVVAFFCLIVGAEIIVRGGKDRGVRTMMVLLLGGCLEMGAMAREETQASPGPLRREQNKNRKMKWNEGGSAQHT
nr:uncharacterized protein LOC112293408 [Physcomitrium patens]|eukprot:XP_024398541.1 uncharacterized protein LOC112293408 [Physcomitrella patens]